MIFTLLGVKTRDDYFFWFSFGLFFLYSSFFLGRVKKEHWGEWRPWMGHFQFLFVFLFLSLLDSVRRRILLLKHVILVLELIDRS